MTSKKGDKDSKGGKSVGVVWDDGDFPDLSGGIGPATKKEEVTQTPPVSYVIKKTTNQQQNKPTSQNTKSVMPSETNNKNTEGLKKEMAPEINKTAGEQTKNSNAQEIKNTAPETKKVELETKDSAAKETHKTAAPGINNNKPEESKKSIMPETNTTQQTKGPTVQEMKNKVTDSKKVEPKTNDTALNETSKPTESQKNQIATEGLNKLLGLQGIQTTESGTKYTMVEETKMVEQKEIKKEPNPSRFLDYNLLPNKSGFTIQGTDFIFNFEEDGGWYDEYGNYYNANGEPENGYEDDYEDYDNYGGKSRIPDFLKDYDIDGYEDDDYDQNYEKYDDYYANQDNNQRLAEYLNDDPVILQFSNISYRSPMNKFLDYLKNARIRFGNPKYDNFNNYGHKGTCSITCENKKEAQEAIKLNGKIFEGRNLKVKVETREEAEDEEEK